MRKIALLLVLLMLFVGMVSCGGNDEPDASDTSSVVSESDSETESSAITDAPSESESESTADTKENWSYRY